MERLTTIYGLVCPLDNEIRYVGKTSGKVNKRLNRHIANYLREQNKAVKNHKERWFGVLQSHNKLHHIKYVIIEECASNISSDREIYWIEQYNTILTKKLTNSTKGGEGTYLDENQLEEFKKKMRETKRGINNPLSKPVYAYNISIKEELYFDSGGICRDHFNMKWSGMLTGLIKHKRLFNDWLFSHNKTEIFEFLKDSPKMIKYGNSGYKTTQIGLICYDIITNTYMRFDSIYKCAIYFNKSEQRLKKYIDEKIIVNNKIIYTQDNKPNLTEYRHIFSAVSGIGDRGLVIELIDTNTNNVIICDFAQDLWLKYNISRKIYTNYCNTDKLYKGRYSIKKIPKPIDYCGSSSISSSSCHLVPAMS